MKNKLFHLCFKRNALLSYLFYLFFHSGMTDAFASLLRNHVIIIIGSPPEGGIVHLVESQLRPRLQGTKADWDLSLRAAIIKRRRKNRTRKKKEKMCVCVCAREEDRR